MKFTFVASLLVTGLSLISVPSFSQQEALIVKDTPAWSAPDRASPHVRTLNKDARVNIITRKGGWYQIQLENQKQAWLPLLNLRFVSEQEANEQSIAEILRQTAEMPTASGLTSGVRGMTNQALSHNKKQPEELLEQVDQYVPTEDLLKEFAEQGLLNSQKEIVIP